MRFTRWVTHTICVKGLHKERLQPTELANQFAPNVGAMYCGASCDHVRAKLHSTQTFNICDGIVVSKMRCGHLRVALLRWLCRALRRELPAAVLAFLDLRSLGLAELFLAPGVGSTARGGSTKSAHEKVQTSAAAHHKMKHTSCTSATYQP